jgi:aspartyl-tRNA synthetase
MFAGVETIRDFIAFPKNNKARDIMIESPSEIAPSQLDELRIALLPKE